MPMPMPNWIMATLELATLEIGNNSQSASPETSRTSRTSREIFVSEAQTTLRNLRASASLRWNQVPGTGFPRAKSAKSAKCINGNFAHFAHFARDGMKPRFMTEFLEKCANVKVLPTANANANAQLDNGNIGTGNIGNWQQFPKCITGNFAHFAHFARDFRSTQKRRMSLPRASPRRCAGTAFVLKLAPLKSAPPPVLICKSETPSGIRVLTHDFPAF